MLETSEENNKALSNLNKKLLRLLNNRCKLASSLLSFSSKISNREHTSQFQLTKDPNSNRVNDLLMVKTKFVNLSDNLLTFRDKMEN